MNSDLHNVEHSMKRREDAARAFLRGGAAPLGPYSRPRLPATFFGSQGGYEQGPDHVHSNYERGAGRFAFGDTSFKVFRTRSTPLKIMVSPVRTRGSPDGPPEGGEVPDLTPAPAAPRSRRQRRGHRGDRPEAGRLGHEEAFLSGRRETTSASFQLSTKRPRVDRSSTDK